MSKIKIFDLSGSESGEFEISEKLLIQDPHNQAIFDVVIAERASRRQGTHSTLTKGEVRGGGKKPYQQKHTGRARQGSTRNPHYVGGGVAFGPKPNRNYEIKVNKKVNKLAFRSAFSKQLFKNVISGLTDDINPDKPSTKSFKLLIEKITNGSKKVLVVLGKPNEVLQKSSKNLQNVILKKWNQVSVEDLLNAQALVIQPSAIISWAERL